MSKNRKGYTRALAIALSAALVGSVVPQMNVNPVSAATKVKIAKNASVTVGATKKLEITSPKGLKVKVVKAVSKKKKIVKVSVSKKAVTIKGLKVGKTEIVTTAKVKSGKKYKFYKLKTKVSVLKAEAPVVTEPATPEITPVPAVTPFSDVPQTPVNTATPGPSGGSSGGSSGSSDGESSGGGSGGGGGGGGGGAGGGGGNTAVTLSATTPEQLVQTLQANKGKTGTLTYTSSATAAETVEIPASVGDTSRIDLIVDAPNTTIKNKAKFKSVKIKRLSPNTWEEEAGNNLIVITTQVHVVVLGGEGTSIELGEGVTTARIENNGFGNSIDKLTVNTSVQARVNLTGTNNTPYTVENKTKDTVLTTKVAVNLETSYAMDLNLLSGAENSTVYQTTTTAVVDICGVGTIMVTTTVTVMNVTAKPLDESKIDDYMRDNAKGTITGSVTDGGVGLSGSTISLYPYRSDFDPEHPSGAAAYTGTAGTDGSYSIGNIAYGNYYVIYQSDSMQTDYQIVTVAEPSVNLGGVTLVFPGTGGALTGSILDAMTKTPIEESGITMELRRGIGVTCGDALNETQTDGNGGYAFSGLNAGNYTVLVSDTRANATTFCSRTAYSFTVRADATTTGNIPVTVTQKTVTEVVQNGVGQLRFVLTWKADDDSGAVPSDLDSHLVGPAVNENGALVPGKDFHIYYSWKNYNHDGEYSDYEGQSYFNSVPEYNRYTRLDVDDTTYEGPETTSVYREKNGVFHFYVYDYSDREDRNNTRLSSSGAKVLVYRGDRVVKSYDVPTGKKGTLWDVCEYDMRNNTITTHDNVFFHYGDSQNVGQDENRLKTAYLEEHSFGIEDIKGADIDDYDIDYDYDDDDQKDYYVQLEGPAATYTGTPTFEFSEEGVTYRLDKTAADPKPGSSHGTWVGLLTAQETVEGVAITKKYRVYYKQVIRLPRLDTIYTDETKTKGYEYDDYDWTDDDDEKYYIFYGEMAGLSMSNRFKFVLDGAEKQVTVNSVTAVADKEYNYVVNATYNGVNYNWYVLYTPYSKLLRRSADCNLNGDWYDVYSIRFNEAGTKVLAKGEATATQFAAGTVSFDYRSLTEIVNGKENYVRVTYALSSSNTQLTLKKEVYDADQDEYVVEKTLATYPFEYEYDEDDE